ncbi:thermonuclease family protein, partial [Cellulomonas septica]|nr:thermonuclease family protein [Cellulomonas septica]
MNRVLLRPARVVVALLLAVVGGAGLTACGGDDSSATVVGAVDGGTFTAERGGDEVRVRLAGVVAPEGGECLADESADALDELLAEDTQVRLEVEAAADGGDELVARVFVDDEEVAAELVGRGLARVAPEVADEEYRTSLLDALERARAEGRGAFDESVACTLPAQLAAFEAAGEDAVAAAAGIGVGVGVDAVDTHGRTL